jgi:hypothetical protein
MKTRRNVYVEFDYRAEKPRLYRSLPIVFIADGRIVQAAGKSCSRQKPDSARSFRAIDPPRSILTPSIPFCLDTLSTNSVNQLLTRRFDTRIFNSLSRGDGTPLLHMD